MDLATHRKSRGLSQEACAIALGLSPTSKGHISGLETGAIKATIHLALQIEAWSSGEVPAESLLTEEDAALLATHRRLAAAQPAEAAA